jgi:hypothetical protein
MNARAYFDGVTAFNSGARFRDNPYRTKGRDFLAELVAWYEGWSTGFDITWRRLTDGQRFQIVMQSSKPRPLGAIRVRRKQAKGSRAVL